MCRAVLLRGTTVQIGVCWESWPRMESSVSLLLYLLTIFTGYQNPYQIQ